MANYWQQVQPLPSQGVQYEQLAQQSFDKMFESMTKAVDNHYGMETLALENQLEGDIDNRRMQLAQLAAQNTQTGIQADANTREWLALEAVDEGPRMLEANQLVREAYQNGVHPSQIGPEIWKGLGFGDQESAYRFMQPLYEEFEAERQNIFDNTLAELNAGYDSDAEPILRAMELDPGSASAGQAKLDLLTKARDEQIAQLEAAHRSYFTSSSEATLFNNFDDLYNTISANNGRAVVAMNRAPAGQAPVGTSPNGSVTFGHDHSGRINQTSTTHQNVGQTAGRFEAVKVDATGYAGDVVRLSYEESQLVRDYVNKYGNNIPEVETFVALLTLESGLDHAASPGSGAEGLSQSTEIALLDMRNRYGNAFVAEGIDLDTNVKDLKTNLLAGVLHFDQAMGNHNGDVVKAFMEYNLGAGGASPLMNLIYDPAVQGKTLEELGLFDDKQNKYAWTLRGNPHIYKPNYTVAQVREGITAAFGMDARQQSEELSMAYAEQTIKAAAEIQEQGDTITVEKAQERMEEFSEDPVIITGVDGTEYTAVSVAAAGADTRLIRPDAPNVTAADLAGQATAQRHTLNNVKTQIIDAHVPTELPESIEPINDLTVGWVAEAMGVKESALSKEKFAEFQNIITRNPAFHVLGKDALAAILGNTQIDTRWFNTLDKVTFQAAFDNFIETTDSGRYISATLDTLYEPIVGTYGELDRILGEIEALDLEWSKASSNPTESAAVLAEMEENRQSKVMELFDDYNSLSERLRVQTGKYEVFRQGLMDYTRRLDEQAQFNKGTVDAAEVNYAQAEAAVESFRKTSEVTARKVDKVPEYFSSREYISKKDAESGSYAQVADLPEAAYKWVGGAAIIHDNLSPELQQQVDDVLSKTNGRLLAMDSVGTYRVDTYGEYTQGYQALQQLASEKYGYDNAKTDEARATALRNAASELQRNQGPVIDKWAEVSAVSIQLKAAEDRGDASEQRRLTAVLNALADEARKMGVISAAERKEMQEALTKGDAEDVESTVRRLERLAQGGVGNT